jgi:ectoine hydroxylase-related dioxygenase (phytanoyl-CoA dioxygenase family)
MLPSPINKIKVLALHLTSNHNTPLLSKLEIQEFKQNGSIVLRQFLDEETIENIAIPILEAYTNNQIEDSAAYDRPDNTSTSKSTYRYPAPGNHPLGSRILEKSPQLASLLASSQKIVSVVEALLGEEARLSQHQVYNRTPGSKGTGESTLGSSAAGCHYDYKPWRSVGSFMKKWLFVVCPLCDYTEEAGPLLVVNGSHKAAEILPSTNDGRTCAFRAPCVPHPEELELHNPQLKRGDILIMDGSTWHAAWGNTSNTDRIGIYLKYHAISHPPAVGPVIHPSIAYYQSSLLTRHVFSYHNHQNYSGINILHDKQPGPTQIFDRSILILEDVSNKIFVINDKVGRKRLPFVRGLDLEMNQYSMKQRNSIQYLDCGNLIKPLRDATHQHFHSNHLPIINWMTWITDFPSKESHNALVR